MENMPVVNLGHARKAFGSNEVLKDISLTVNQGDVLSIIGPSGGGKSTLLRCMTLLETLDAGSLAYGDVKVAEADSTGKAVYGGKDVLAQAKERYGLVFQNFNLFPQYTARQNVMLASELLAKEQPDYKTRKKQVHAQIAARAEELLTQVGLKEKMDLYPHQLSGGMRQRVVIAIALACNPDLLICDEPTTALDVTIQAQILDLMNQLKKETGTSILFITHDLGVVAEVCDDVAVMYCGRVVERGDVKTIFANPSHPYTKGLLGSIPRLGDAGKELKSIPGNVPNPKYMPKGCKFAPRCPYASEKCREEEPGFFQIEEGHISRCWLCESGQLKTDHVEKAGD